MTVKNLADADLEKMVFVFGSNLSGLHGAGAAHFAFKHRGAVIRQGVGMQGNSYAIPTKDYDVATTLSLQDIATHVQNFILVAEANPTLQFQVTRVGCGLAGLKDREIAPMFTNAPENCFFDTKWYTHLGSNKNYWGTID